MCENCKPVMSTTVQRPFLLTRWWVKSREITPEIFPGGFVGAPIELYVPFWAKPLEWLYSLVFGSVKIKPCSCQGTKQF